MTRHTITRQTILVLALILASLLVTVQERATDAAPAAPDGTPATVTMSARVTVGQEMLVAVKINPSTGYHWVVRPVPGLTVTSLDVPTRKVDPQHPLVGVPVIRIYQITAVAARTTPYVVLLVEQSPAGRPTGATVVVTIAVQARPAR